MYNILSSYRSTLYVTYWTFEKIKKERGAKKKKHKKIIDVCLCYTVLKKKKVTHNTQQCKISCNVRYKIMYAYSAYRECEKKLMKINIICIKFYYNVVLLSREICEQNRYRQQGLLYKKNHGFFFLSQKVDKGSISKPFVSGIDRCRTLEKVYTYHPYHRFWSWGFYTLLDKSFPALSVHFDINFHNTMKSYAKDWNMYLQIPTKSLTTTEHYQNYKKKKKRNKGTKRGYETEEKCDITKCMM